jgi:hypothetical protein
MMKTAAVSSPFQDCGLAIALVTNLGVYTGVAVCFAAAVYWLMQPTVVWNPGLAAYKPLPGTVVIYARSTWAPFAPPEPPAQFVAEEPAPEVVESAAIALFNVHGNSGPVDDRVLSEAVVFGSERTIEQDPTFAFRIVVDIALRALSPAINDPTTAVLAIDQLDRLLRRVGQRNLRTGHIFNEAGQLRVIFKTPNWEDFVHLAFSEIRSCGSGNLQIVRRLRAMIENLLQTSPEHRRPCLQQQLGLLDREIETKFNHPEDLALARISDNQGLGGRSGYAIA